MNLMQLLAQSGILILKEPLPKAIKSTRPCPYCGKSKPDNKGFCSAECCREYKANGNKKKAD